MPGSLASLPPSWASLPGMEGKGLFFDFFHLAQHRAGGGRSRSLSEAGAQHEMQKLSLRLQKHLTWRSSTQWMPGTMSVLVFGFS